MDAVGSCCGVKEVFPQVQAVSGPEAVCWRSIHSNALKATRSWRFSGSLSILPMAMCSSAGR